MTADETVRIGITADTAAFDRAIGDLTLRAGALGAALTGALKGAVAGGQSLDGVLKGLALRVSSVALGAALKPLEQMAGTFLGGAVGALGSLLGGGAMPAVTPFAKGGVVAAPSFFPNGRQIGLMGEAGAEAVLPLRRGPDGSLGVAAGGEGKRAPTIVFNVTASDAASFRRSEAQVQAMLARATERGRRGL